MFEDALKVHILLSLMYVDMDDSAPHVGIGHLIAYKYGIADTRYLEQRTIRSHVPTTRLALRITRK